MTAADGVADGVHALPERVGETIRRQQDNSEILIGWVQLAIVLVFSSLYAISPKTFSPDAITPVPWVLGLYSAFTLLRLGLALRLHLADWFLYLSIVIDMMLLLGLIWSFHVQYMQPPSFYLKVPTLLYVFIFIALRALRFEARFVVVAGCTAALGWLAMAVYAVVVTGPEMVTRDYVYYMTHNAVLFGAEFDKIISILVVTAILAASLNRARGLLVKSVAEGTAAEDLSRFFAPEIAQRIRDSEQRLEPGAGETRRGVIVDIDIRGFTRLAADIPPTELIALLTEYQSRVVPVIRRHGGSVDKFLGDGIMATFGVSKPLENDALAALTAVDEIITAAEDWRQERRRAGQIPLEINLAAVTGEVVFGAVGDADRLEYTVIGESVNLAAKLEKHNKVERVRALTTLACYQEARAQGYRPGQEAEIRRGVKVEGVDSRLDLAVLAP